MRAFTIVVVDDEPDIRAVIADLLAAEGYSVRVAANGLEALEAVHELGADRCLVLLDMYMPKMTGEEFLRAVRAEGHLPALRVIVLSATKPTFAATAGARLCLHKPVALDALLRVVERLSSDTSEVSDESCARLLSSPPDRGPALAKCGEDNGADAARLRRRETAD